MVAAIRLQRSPGGDEMSDEDWAQLRTDPNYSDLRETIQVQFFRRAAIERTAARMADELRAPIDPRSEAEKADAWKRTVEAGSQAGKFVRHAPNPADLGTAHPVREYDPYGARALRE